MANEFLHPENELFLDKYNLIIDPNKSYYDNWRTWVLDNHITYPIERTIAFFKKYGYSFKDLSSYNHTLLLIEGERERNVYPLGRKWEHIDNVSDDLLLELVMGEIKKMKTNMKIVSESKYDLKTLKKKFDYMKPSLNIKNTTFEEFNAGYKQFKRTAKSVFDYHAWKHLLNVDNSHEVEFRFRNITGLEYKNLLNYLTSSDQFISRNVICTINRVGNVRRVVFNENLSETHEVFEKKTELSHYIIRNWDVKLAVSKETTIDKKEFDVKGTQVVKNMLKFYTPVAKNSFYNTEITLSTISTGEYHMMEYNIEIERKFGSIKNPERLLYDIFSIMQGTSNITPYSTKKTIMHKYFNRGVRAAFKQVLPLSLTRENVQKLTKSVLYCTPKVDGTRVAVFIHSNYGIYLIHLDGTFIKMGFPPNYKSDGNDILLMLDAELMRIGDGHQIFLFDILYDTFDIHRQIYSVRYATLEKTIIPLITKFNFKNYEFIIKPSIRLKGTLDDLYKMVLNVPFKVAKFSGGTHQRTSRAIKFDETQVDGLIFYIDGFDYFQTPIYKLKRGMMNTIDMLIKPYHPEIDTKNPPMIHNVPQYTHLNLSNYVVECAYNKTHDVFIPLKIRFDKRAGNNPDVIADTKSIVSDDIEQDLLHGNKLIVARKIINNLKLSILKYQSEIYCLLDIGSGQGGDIDKWGDISKIYAVEKSADMMNLFEERLKKNTAMEGRINRIYSDFVDVPYIDGIDIVTLFFSVNTVFESKDYFQKYISKLVELNPKKIFILYHPYEKLKTMNTTCFTLKKGKNANIYGKEYEITISNSHVNKVKEYAFNEKVFIETLEKQNYICQVYTPFYNHTNKPITTLSGVVLTPTVFNMSKNDTEWLKSVRYIECVCQDYSVEDEFVDTEEEEQDDYTLGGVPVTVDDITKAQNQLERESSQISLNGFSSDEDAEQSLELLSIDFSYLFSINSPMTETNKWNALSPKQTSDINKTLSLNLTPKEYILLYYFLFQTESNVYYNIPDIIKEFFLTMKNVLPLMGTDNIDDADTLINPDHPQKNKKHLYVLDRIPSDVTLGDICNFNTIELIFPKNVGGCIILAESYNKTTSIVEKRNYLKLLLVNYTRSVNLSQTKNILSNKLSSLMSYKNKLKIKLYPILVFTALSKFIPDDVKHPDLRISDIVDYYRKFSFMNKIESNVYSMNTMLTEQPKETLNKPYFVIENKNNIEYDFKFIKKHNLIDAILESDSHIDEAVWDRDVFVSLLNKENQNIDFNYAMNIQETLGLSNKILLRRIIFVNNDTIELYGEHTKFDDLKRQPVTVWFKNNTFYAAVPNNRYFWDYTIDMMRQDNLTELPLKHMTANYVDHYYPYHSLVGVIYKGKNYNTFFTRDLINWSRYDKSQIHPIKTHKFTNMDVKLLFYVKVRD